MFANHVWVTQLRLIHNPTKTALAGYKDPKPMVFSGLFPLDGADFPVLREALDKLQLNDAALVYEPESSAALGFRFPLRLPWSASYGNCARAPRARIKVKPYFNCTKRGL